MGYYDKFKSVLNTILFFTGLPALTSFVAPIYTDYDPIPVFFLTLLIVWIASIELRLKDFKEGKKKNGKK